jgi:hypothetical protein
MIITASCQPAGRCVAPCSFSGHHWHDNAAWLPWWCVAAWLPCTIQTQPFSCTAALRRACMHGCIVELLRQCHVC